jgi:hypothetical protein
MSAISRRIPVVLLVLSFGTLVLSAVCLGVGAVVHGELLFRVALACGAASAALAVVVRFLARQRDLHPRVRRSLAWWGVLFGGTLLSFLLVPAVGSGCNAARRMERMTDLNQIAAAMHGYAETHGDRFPPAALRDKAGEPLLSWRVLILPHLGEAELCDQFRLDEPWDSPHNLALLPRIPKVFRPSVPDRLPTGHTRFQIFVGPGTPFAVAEGPHRKRDFPNGLSNALLVTEGAESVPWTKPDDLSYPPDGPLPPLGVPSGPERPFWLERGTFAFAYADGSVSWGRAGGDPGEKRLRQLILGKGAVQGNK